MKWGEKMDNTTYEVFYEYVCGILAGKLGDKSSDKLDKIQSACDFVEIMKGKKIDRN